MPESVPTSVKRVLNILSESIFIMALVLVILLVTIGTLSRVNRLANVAQFLPAGTEAFVVVNLDDYGMDPSPLLTDFYEHDLQSLEWFGRDVALAWVDGEMMKFIEVNSRPQAERFMEDLLIEDEVFIDHADYHCYSVAQPECYTFRGRYLVLGLPAALDLLEPGLESTIAYQNVRHRLPYNGSIFAYVDTMSVRQNFLTSLGDLSVWEPGYLESILHIFPVYGVSVEVEGEEWKSESFIAVDKSALGDEAFFHPSIKFNGELMAYAPEGFEFEWSGVEMGAMLERLNTHLENLNPAAALVLNENINSYWSQYFGDADIQEYGPLLDQEYMLSWNPGGDYVYLLNLNEEDRDSALKLKDYFIATYQVSNLSTNEKGETIASIDSITASKEKYNGSAYFQMGTEGNPSHFLAILDEVIISSNNETHFFETLDRWTGRAETRDLDQVLPMLLGTDFAMSLDMTHLPESHIINVLLPGVKTWMSSTKLFDDGIYIRSHLTY